MLDRSRNAAFRRHHTSLLLLRTGQLLPILLDNQSASRASREIQTLCWRELGYLQQPVFDGDLPQFLMADANGNRVGLSCPIGAAEFAVRLISLAPPALPESSVVGTNLNSLSSLLGLTPYEAQWLLWSYCVRRFGSAILPVIPLRNQEHACEVLALLSDVPVVTVEHALATRRLHAWRLLDGIGANGEMPSLLSGWFSATDQFADWIEQPYDSDTDLLIALCQAQVSLPASR